MHPRIQLLMRGSIVSIQFGDTVVICAPGKSIPFSARCSVHLMLWQIPNTLTGWS